MKIGEAKKAIRKYGMVLVFPINNAKQPVSLWSHFFPRTKMRWEWDENGDSKVAELWHLREQLSHGGGVVYTKWFRGRATFFSSKTFAAFLAGIHREDPKPGIYPPESFKIRSLLEENSPLSTKALKRESQLQGKYLEGIYTKALQPLWSSLLIVGCGEVDDGAFPSLAMGATNLIFEAEWRLGMEGDLAEHRQERERIFKQSPCVAQFYQKVKMRLAQP